MNLSLREKKKIIAVFDHPVATRSLNQQAEPAQTEQAQWSSDVPAQAENQEWVNAENLEAMIEAKAEERAKVMVEQQLKSLGQMVQQAVMELQEVKTELGEELEKGALKLAYEIAKKIVRKEIQHSPDVILYTVREALQLVANAREVTLTCHPEDLALLEKDPDFAQWLQNHENTFKLRPDENLERGGCILESESGTIDARIESQLQEIEKQLFAFA